MMIKCTKKTLLGVIGVYLSASSYASECSFTVEQDRLLHLASSYGEPHDYRKTLPAIVMQESFVGKYIVRINPKDGKMGSYGITHVLLSTAMWLTGETNRWKAKDELVERLIKDDVFSLHLAVKKLDSVRSDSWMNTWRNYNSTSGGDTYANKIRNNIRLLERCGYFSNWG